MTGCAGNKLATAVGAGLGDGRRVGHDIGFAGVDARSAARITRIGRGAVKLEVATTIACCLAFAVTLTCRIFIVDAAAVFAGQDLESRVDGRKATFGEEVGTAIALLFAVVVALAQLVEVVFAAAVDT